MSIGSKKSSTNTTTNNYDQRVVTDNSGGGKSVAASAVNAEAGSLVSKVDGTGNTITDGGAFEIVDKLVTSIGNVAAAQTQVARDIALSSSTQGVAYADIVNKSIASQVAAMTENDRLSVAAQSLAGATDEPVTFSGKAWAVAAAAGALILYFLKRK